MIFINLLQESLAEGSVNEMDIIRETTYTACCNRCGNIETYDELGGHPTKRDAERAFRKAGWREKDGETLCPECMRGGE